MITLTRELIFECRTDRGGWNKETIEAFGMEWKEMTRGWIDRLEGKQIPDEDWRKALEGKFKPQTNVEAKA